MVRRFALALTLAALLAATPVRGALAQANLSVQEMSLRVTPAVVLVVAEVAAEVVLDCGSGPTTVTPPLSRETGTGWFIDERGWIITNGHVVQPAHVPPRWLINQQAQRAVVTACLPNVLARQGITPGEWPDKEDSVRRKLLEAILPTTKVKLTPQVTVVVGSTRLKAEVKKYSAPLSNDPGAMSGRDLALLKVTGDTFPVLPLADSKTVQIGDAIHIVGFPGVVLSHELLNKAAVQASVTNGAVSGFQPDVSNQPVIQTDAPASWGNSGGPAVNSKGAVVGVLTFVSLAPGAEGSIVQGFNFVIPAQFVREFVAGTEVRLDRNSRFNDIWYEGLRAYFTDDWSRAAKQFERAAGLLAGLPAVKRMQEDAQEKLKNPPPRPFPWFWVAIGVTFLSAAGYGTQFAVRWQKNRYRVQPSEVVRLLESGKSPILVDARRKEVYDTLPLTIPGSVRLAPEEISSGASGLELDTNRPVVAYCT
jgi:S1-C subfamily serine protease